MVVDDQVIQYCGLFEQFGGLESLCDIEVGNVVWCYVGDVYFVEFDVVGGGWYGVGYQVEEGGFVGVVGVDDGVDLIGGEFYVYVVDCCQVVEVFGEIIDFKYCCGFFWMKWCCC